MSVYLGFGIEITQVEYMFIVGFEYKSVACGEQVMVEKNQGNYFGNNTSI